MENLILPLVVGAAVVVGVLVVGLFVLRRWSDAPARTGFMPATPPESEPLAPHEEIDALLARGQKIQAIKRVRELTGMGLKEAKDYVDARPLRPPLHDLMPVGRTQALNSDLEQEARRLLNERGKIEAIRRVRERTGMGLKEAKDYVDAL